MIQIAGSDDKGYDPTRKTAKKGLFYAEHVSAGQGVTKAVTSGIMPSGRTDFCTRNRTMLEINS